LQQLKTVFELDAKYTGDKDTFCTHNYVTEVGQLHVSIELKPCDHESDTLTP